MPLLLGAEKQKKTVAEPDASLKSSSTQIRQPDNVHGHFS
jgi:hypothetical protein